MSELASIGFHDAVIAEYRRAVGAGDSNEGINRQDAFAFANEAIRERIHTGEIEIPIDDAIHSALMAADNREGQQADSILAKIARGEIGLDVHPDPILNVVVTLGKGKRKPWKYVTAEDVRDMAALRKQNTNSARRAESRFLKNIGTIYADLVTAGTVGEMFTAVEAA